ncbi:MAG: NAD(P)/FAD-dependent oxidoreductase [Oligoflexia bacterium]|nr:NAD(P)/FAD-dependent oxidoreductase [Oligoflexia bacterium]
MVSSKSNSNNNYDVIVIGGGIVGASIIRELSRYDLKICLIEKEAELSFGVSKSNSGIVHAGFHSPPNTLKGPLCARGNFLYDQLHLELGVPFKRVGELVIIKQSEEIPDLEKFKRWGEECGVPGMKILNESEVHQYEPSLSTDVIGALYAPTAGVVNPYEFVFLLAQNAKKNGAEIKTSEEVISIGDRVAKTTEVITTKDRYNTKYIINAAGLYGDRIANMVGIYNFKIIPRKGEEYLLDKKLKGLVKQVIFPLPSKTSKGTLVIPTLDGTIMVGPSAEDIDDKNDLTTTDEVCWQIFDKAKQMIPAIHHKYLISTFAGNRPVPVKLIKNAKGKYVKDPDGDDDFIIAKTDDVPGFINVAGIQSPGLTAAPAIAEKVISILKDDGVVLKANKYFVSTNPNPKKIREMSDDELDKLIKSEPDYGKIVCRCEMVSEGEIMNAIENGAQTLDGVKFRTRAGMGRCQGGFCSFKTMELLAKGLDISPLEITKRGEGSNILVEDLKKQKEKI